MHSQTGYVNMNRNVLLWMIITVAYTMGFIWEVCSIDTFMIIR